MGYLWEGGDCIHGGCAAYAAQRGLQLGRTWLSKLRCQVRGWGVRGGLEGGRVLVPLSSCLKTFCVGSRAPPTSPHTHTHRTLTLVLTNTLWVYRS
jgi:hypothetical protein